MNSELCYIPISTEAKGPIVKELRINLKIPAQEVFLLGAEGERLGVMPLRRALEIAQGQELDVVEVAAQQSPPVCRVMDYGRYKFEQSKKEHKAKRGQRSGSLSEVRLRPRVKEHDLETKARLVQRLLAEGCKVKVVVVFRGREGAHPELGWKAMQKLSQFLKGKAAVEREPNMEEQNLTMVFTPPRQVAEVKKSVEVEDTPIKKLKTIKEIKEAEANKGA